MNIALSSIFFFLLLLPGLIFRKFYYSEEFSREYFRQTPFEVFVSAFIPAVILQIIFYFFANFLIGINFQVIGRLLTAKDYDEIVFNNIQHYCNYIISYQLLINLFAVTSGYFCKRLIRRNRLDRIYKLFRYENSWHYLFSGEFFEFPRATYNLFNDNIDEIELVYIDALIEAKEGSQIYDGILVDYELSKDGGLSYIVMKETERRLLTNDPLENESDEERSERYYQIPGHVVIIPFSKIINLNLSFYKIDYDPEDSSWQVSLVS